MQLPRLQARAAAGRPRKSWTAANSPLAGRLRGDCCLLVFSTYISAQPKSLTDKDTIVLADFANTTGDPVFDGTLRQGLAVQLEQTPYLSLISDARIGQTLRLMGQQAGARLTPETAYEVCRRTQSAAVIDGSIAKLGEEYVLGLKAVNCQTGDTLAEEQVRANGKEQVLGAMDKAAAQAARETGRIGQEPASIRHAAGAGDYTVAGSAAGLQPGTQDVL